MRKSKLVSVIVPMQNSEKYIRECLSSISSQTYANLEIILIDDCSSDDTAEKCREMMNNDSRIRLIREKKSVGSAACRNLGMDESTGEFVMFVDSDDYIYPDMVERMMAIVEKEKVDLVRCNIEREQPNGKINSENIEDISGRKIVNKKEINEIRKRFVTACNNISCYSVLLLFKKTLDVRYKIDLSFTEDTEFYVNLFGKASSIYFLDEALYHYRYNPSSLSRKANVQAIIDNMESAILSYFYIEKAFKSENVLDKIIKKDEMDKMLFNVLFSRLFLLGKFNIAKITSGLKAIMDRENIMTRMLGMNSELFSKKQKVYRYMFCEKKIIGLALVIRIRGKLKGLRK